MKSLVLAEKPSVARELGRVLKCGNKGKGFLEGQQYVVTWALGHLVTLAEPEDYDKRLKEWRMEDLPMLPGKMKLKIIKQTSHQFNVVRGLMNRPDIKDLVIATDAGREGELVARWIMEMAHWKKPFKRLWISSQTDEAVKAGFAKLQPGEAYNHLFDAAACRAEADWLIGLNVTRTLTCKFNAQLNAGRVQTPTLAMIVKREQEIKDFKPVDYWTIRADFGAFYGDWRDQGGGRIFDPDKAAAIAEGIKGQHGVIREVKSETRSEAPPLAYDLAELQRDANRRFAWPAHKTLSVLQDLYEKHKIVSYPRTDSRYITSDMKDTLVQRLQAIAAGPYSQLAKKLLSTPLKSSRLVDDSKVSDHHAIIPTEQVLNLKALDNDEKKLFDLIARRFMAVLSPPARSEHITITTEVNGQLFISRGKTELEPGWKEVQTLARDRDSSREVELPEQALSRHSRGEKVAVQQVRQIRQKTRPPARHSDASLLTAMETSGLGTPATRAEIIEKLIHASYIERHGREFIPTSKGIQLVSLVPETLRSPELTARWEKRLADIARGQAGRIEFGNDIRKDAHALVDEIRMGDAVYKADNLTRHKCPVCGQRMLLVNGRRGRTLACQDRSCGYRQPEKSHDRGQLSRASRAEQKLVERYSDKEEIGTNLGDLLKAALAQKAGKDGDC